LIRIISQISKIGKKKKEGLMKLVNMVLRKIMQIGSKHKSFAVTLPKEWIAGILDEIGIETFEKTGIQAEQYYTGNIVTVVPKTIDNNLKEKLIDFLKNPDKYKMMLLSLITKLSQINSYEEFIKHKNSLIEELNLAIS
jgi:hypothetical protein